MSISSRTLSCHAHSSRRPTGGFTLVELVVVIVVLGVLAAIATPRFAGDRAFAERGYYEELVSAFKLARKQAVASGCPVRVTLTTGGYRGRQQRALDGRCDPSDASFPLDVRLADGRTLSGSAPAGVSASPATVVTFDTLGGTDLGAETTITVGAFAFTIHASSGYIETP